MDENNEIENKSKDSHKLFLTSIFLVMAVALIGGAFYFLKGGSNTNVMSDQVGSPTENVSTNMSVSDNSNVFDDAMMEGSEEEEAMEGDTSTTTDEITVEVEGGNYYFKPNEIKVKKGQPVNIVFNSMEGFHDFVIDEFNVKTDITPGGKTARVSFTPDKTGTFEFYCSVGNHRQMGMWGKLVVEE